VLLADDEAKALGVLPGEYVGLRVEDTGCGMDQATLSRIFEPFFTTKERGKGTGLGLATVYGIVHGTGGAVRARSEPGRGTVIEALLPSVRRPAEEASKAPHDQVGPGRGSETILLVEDEPMVLRLVQDVLHDRGYNVLAAVRGEDALRLCGGHAGPIALLLTDVMMPGMNGRELAERLTVERPEMRVLFMSGYTDDAALRRGVLDDSMPFIQKPFRPDLLARTVRAVLDGAALPST
jgi:CheY-like chemotaxis protein